MYVVGFFLFLWFLLPINIRYFVQRLQIISTMVGKYLLAYNKMTEWEDTAWKKKNLSLII